MISNQKPLFEKVGNGV